MILQEWFEEVIEILFLELIEVFFWNNFDIGEQGSFLQEDHGVIFFEEESLEFIYIPFLENFFQEIGELFWSCKFSMYRGSFLFKGIA